MAASTAGGKGVSETPSTRAGDHFHQTLVVDQVPNDASNTRGIGNMRVSTSTCLDRLFKTFLFSGTSSRRIFQGIDPQETAT